MSDKGGDSSLSRKAGRGFLRLLVGIFGEKNVARGKDSVRVLKEEFRAGREEGEGEAEPPVRPIPHREVED